MFKLHKLRKKLIAACLGLALGASCLAATTPIADSTVCHLAQAAAQTDEDISQANEADKWMIFWYICGTDLEEESWAATEDLEEMENGHLPPNASVIVQMGGAQQWHNSLGNANGTMRYLYNSDGFSTLEEMPYQDMGDQSTLQDFLAYSAQYPAEHKMVIIWDHGGGTLGGACYDSKTGNHLSLNDIQAAFDAVYPASPDNPPLDIVGFDCCLMATYDTANMLYGTAKYMVASEELEPGCGWYYTDIMDAIGNNPDITPAQLGTAICDGYVKGCQAADSANNITLSVLDLSYMPNITAAYENWGSKVSNSSPASGVLTNYVRSCSTVEQYGGDNEGNQIDLGHLALKTTNITSQESNAFLNALKQAVVYKVNGPYRSHANGLSGFYPTSGNSEDVDKYEKVASSSPVYSQLFQELLGNAPLSAEELTTLQNIDVKENDAGYATVDLEESIVDALSEVRFVVAKYDADADTETWLGEDDDLTIDWETGHFEDNFQGEWLSLDGYPLCTTLNEANENYNVYTAPITHNGKNAELVFVEDFDTNQFNILGVSYDTENGMASRTNCKLKPGDKIGIRYKQSNNLDFEHARMLQPSDTLTISGNTSIELASLPDGTYFFAFEFVTLQQEVYLSKYVIFSIDNGKITLETT